MAPARQQRCTQRVTMVPVTPSAVARLRLPAVPRYPAAGRAGRRSTLLAFCYTGSDRQDRVLRRRDEIQGESDDGRQGVPDQPSLLGWSRTYAVAAI